MTQRLDVGSRASPSHALSTLDMQKELFGDRATLAVGAGGSVGRGCWRLGTMSRFGLNLLNDFALSTAHRDLVAAVTIQARAAGDGH
ncbi:MAG: hypothetical protein K0R38_6380 [Polyangiaceae bacterium]|nr:hypothetical protein [Polyangiaceae bacterium]